MHTRAEVLGLGHARHLRRETKEIGCYIPEHARENHSAQLSVESEEGGGPVQRGPELGEKQADRKHEGASQSRWLMLG